MSNATATAPPAITLAEKAAMLGAAFVVAALLAIPGTRGVLVDSVTATAHFAADTIVNGVSAVGSLFGNLLGLD